MRCSKEVQIFFWTSLVVIRNNNYIASGEKMCSNRLFFLSWQIELVLENIVFVLQFPERVCQLENKNSLSCNISVGCLIINKSINQMNYRKMIKVMGVIFLVTEGMHIKKSFLAHRRITLIITHTWALRGALIYNKKATNDYSYLCAYCTADESKFSA